jgi:urease accessory protein
MGLLVKVQERVASSLAEDVTLTLPYSIRQKYRFRATLDNGVEIGVMLSREGVLRGGDCLRSDDGMIIKICAENELLSIIESNSSIQLMRACYHLGNRHVALQIGDGWIRYQYDHVLDDMICQLKLSVRHALTPFEPDSGAYHHRH